MLISCILVANEDERGAVIEAARKKADAILIAMKSNAQFLKVGKLLSKIAVPFAILDFLYDGRKNGFTWKTYAKGAASLLLIGAGFLIGGWVIAALTVAYIIWDISGGTNEFLDDIENSYNIHKHVFSKANK